MKDNGGGGREGLGDYSSPCNKLRKSKPFSSQVVLFFGWFEGWRIMSDPSWLSTYIHDSFHSSCIQPWLIKRQNRSICSQYLPIVWDTYIKPENVASYQPIYINCILNIFLLKTFHIIMFHFPWLIKDLVNLKSYVYLSADGTHEFKVSGNVHSWSWIY